MRALERIDLIGREHVGPLLKLHGFRKSGRTWRRAVGNVVQVVNLQASRWNSAESGDFTCNLGVYFPAAAELAESATAGKENPGEADCIVSERLGVLMPVGRDYWWRIDEQSHDSLVGREVANAIAEYGLRWLDEHSGLAGAEAWSATKNLFFWAAVFALCRGERSLAERYVERAISGAAGAQPLEGRLRDWAERRHLIPSGRPSESNGPTSR